MSKSHWLKDQKGNFSDGKKDTFNPSKKYVGIRLQQGKPLLDRDWNESEDIRRYEEEALRKWYVGNGTPDNGFKISATNPPTMYFKIKAGRCLVNGFEAVNKPENGKYILYYEQEGIQKEIEKLKAPTKGTREDTVYLDVWIGEVTSAEEGALKNSQDVNVETCVRHRLNWRVKVDVGSKGYKKERFHHYYDLAKIKRKAKINIIKDEDNIVDLRRTNLSLHHLRDAAESLLNNSIADDLHNHTKLVASGDSQKPTLTVNKSGDVCIGLVSEKPQGVLNVLNDRRPHAVLAISLNEFGSGIQGQSKKGAGVVGSTMYGRAIYGNGNAGWAGFFNGKVHVSGNVGIGTTNPSSKLEVNGSVITDCSNYGATSFNVASYFTNVGSKHYIHIKLPYNLKVHNHMYHIKVRGYAFAATTKVIDLTFVGYCYKNRNSLIRTEVFDPKNAFEATQYVGRDKHIYLRFKARSTYYLSFAVDSMRVGNGRVIKPGEITIARSSAATL